MLPVREKGYVLLKGNEVEKVVIENVVYMDKGKLLPCPKWGDEL